MTRSRLSNKFRQHRTISPHVAYKKQRNIYIKLLQKIKKYFFNNLDVNGVIVLVKIFNEYFSSIVSNLDIQCTPSITLHHDSLLNAIKKIKNHPSILEIKKNSV